MKKAFSTVFIVFIFFICLNASVYSADFEAVLGDAAGTNAVSIKDSSGTNEVSFIDSRGKMMFKGAIQTYCADFYTTESPYGPTMNDPWLGAAVSSGTMTKQTGFANHPGVCRFTAAAGGGTGYRLLTDINPFLIAGGEYSEFVFYLTTTDANTTIRMGFQDSITSTAPTDGVWVDIANTTLSGKTSAASSASTTGSTYTVSIGTSNWYRAAIAVNSDASRVDFYLYSAAGSQLWTDYLTANIPTTAGNETGHGIVALSSGSKAIMDLDYMNIAIRRTLTR